jgi:hypothetical protein
MTGVDNYNDEYEYDYASETAGHSAVPYWAYSDDEDLSDTHEDGRTADWWEAGVPVVEIVAAPDDDVEWAPVPPPMRRVEGQRVRPTQEEVFQLLARPHVSWTHCLEAVEAAKAVEAWDLLEAAAVRALAIAHRDDYQYTASLGAAARQVLVAKCARATAGRPAEALRDGQVRLRAVADDARNAGRSSLADAVDGEVEAAAEMLLLLTRPDHSGAIAQLAGQLRRRLGRADLAEQTATCGIELDPDNPAPWVARAAARADQRNHKGALADLDQDLLSRTTSEQP